MRSWLVSPFADPAAQRSGSEQSSCNDAGVLRKDYADYREAMRTLFNDVDPMGLISGGAPWDEYEPEINDLLKWRKTVSPDDVVAVFQRWFNTEIDAQTAARLAAGISEVRARFGYETH